MDLSPNDIRNYEFPNQMRGYDKEEVDNFMEQVAGALEAAKQEQLRLSMELDSVKSQLSGLKQFEDTIKNAAIDARRNADSLVAAAKKEAEEILSEAKSEVSQAMASRTQQVSEIEDQITQIGLTKKSYFTKIRSLIESHLKMIDDIELGDLEVGDSSEASSRSEDEIEITESNEMKSRKRETVATLPSTQTSIKAEEANAPEDSIEGLSESSKEDLSQALKSVLGGESEEEEAEEPGPIDPELAAALENYKKAAEEQAKPAPAPQPEAPPAPPAPPQGVMQETSALAEDIPAGFVTNEVEQINTDTDKMAVPSHSAGETQRVSAAAPGNNKAESVEPESLAKNLDEVVAKFEEEMDKAEHSQ